MNQGSQALAGLKVEDNDFILSRAVETIVRAEAQSSWLFIRYNLGPEDPHKIAFDRIIFTYCCNRVWIAEGPLAGHDNVAVWRNCQIKWADFRVAHVKSLSQLKIWAEGQNGVIAFPGRSNA